MQYQIAPALSFCDANSSSALKTELEPLRVDAEQLRALACLKGLHLRAAGRAGTAAEPHSADFLAYCKIRIEQKESCLRNIEHRQKCARCTVQCATVRSNVEVR